MQGCPRFIVLARAVVVARFRGHGRGAAVAAEKPRPRTAAAAPAAAAPATSTTTSRSRWPSGMAPTPPMGWNSWNKFGCNIERRSWSSRWPTPWSRAGMKDAGYQYVNIDDCWSTRPRARPTDRCRPTRHVPRTASRRSPTTSTRKGLKLGIYGDRGTATCGGYPGSQGHEVQDATTFASWGVDYLKYDNCAADAGHVQTQYQAMQRRARRPPASRSCSASAPGSSTSGASRVGNLWRTTGDIRDNWPSIVRQHHDQPDRTPPTRARTAGTIPTCWRSASDNGYGT